jgi:hypothetical protein
MDDLNCAVNTVPRFQSSDKSVVHSNLVDDIGTKHDDQNHQETCTTGQ